MTERQMNNRIAKLQGIETQMEELKAQAETIRAELKADLESKGEDEHNTGSFIIRWKEIISRRLGSKALKAALPAHSVHDLERRCGGCPAYPNSSKNWKTGWSQK